MSRAAVLACCAAPPLACGARATLRCGATPTAARRRRRARTADSASHATPSQSAQPRSRRRRSRPTSSAAPRDVPVDTPAHGSRPTAARCSKVERDLRRRARSPATLSPATTRPGSPTGLLEPGTTYAVTTHRPPTPTAPHVTTRPRFRTQRPDASTSRPTRRVAPLHGETVGVGMPVIVTFDVAGDRQGGHREAPARSPPRREQPGAWHWLSDNEVHWRPKTYWKRRHRRRRRRRRQQRRRPATASTARRTATSTSTSATRSSTRSTRRPTR